MTKYILITPEYPTETRDVGKSLVGEALRAKLLMAHHNVIFVDECKQPEVDCVTQRVTLDDVKRLERQYTRTWRNGPDYIIICGDVQTAMQAWQHFDSVFPGVDITTIKLQRKVD